MEDVDEFLENKSRRDVLKTSGLAIAAGLAGCIGGQNNDQTTESNETETEGEPTRTSTNDGQGTDTTETPTQAYPQQDSQRLQSDIDQAIRENEGIYGLKAAIEDLEIEQFNDVVESVPGYDSKEEMLGNSWEFDRALYVISETETAAGPTENVYFLVQDPTESPNGNNAITMFANANEQNADITDQDIQTYGVPREYDEERLNDEEKVIKRQQDFLSETLSTGDVVHAVNLEDTYVEEAIE
jgi:hypothetical protein